MVSTHPSTPAMAYWYDVVYDMCADTETDTFDSESFHAFFNSLNTDSEKSTKGGRGSGNHGHAGNPGHVGGSGHGGGTNVTSSEIGGALAHLDNTGAEPSAHVALSLSEAKDKHSALTSDFGMGHDKMDADGTNNTYWAMKQEDGSLTVHQLNHGNKDYGAYYSRFDGVPSTEHKQQTAITDAERAEFRDKFVHRAELMGGNKITEAPGVGYEETVALKLYTGEDYGSLNTSLRNGEMSSDQKLLSKFVDAGLTKLPDHSGTVYRGLRVPASYKKDTAAFVSSTFKEGSVFSDSAYMSTSKSETMVSNYTNWSSSKVVLHVNSKTGKTLEDVSFIKGEKEVLFTKSAQFVTTSVKYDAKTDTHTITLDEVQAKSLKTANARFEAALQASDEEHHAALVAEATNQQ